MWFSAFVDLVLAGLLDDSSVPKMMNPSLFPHRDQERTEMNTDGNVDGRPDGDDLKSGPASVGSPAKSGPKIRSDLVVVGIGASAGGVEALEKLFSKMPTDTGMAFVVVQHLSPDFESLMPQILSRKTTMPVEPISHGATLRPNHVFVLPSGKDVTVDKGLLLTKDHTIRRQHQPIDCFFRSLASQCQENAVAVVLSGTGSDGSSGIKDVHALGGLVIVQSEISSKFNGMPRAAIATGLTDAIVAVEEIPEALIRFGEFSREPTGKSRQEMFSETLNAESRVYHLLHKKYGIDFEQYKADMIGRRIARRMLLIKDSDIDTYVKNLESDPDELKALYDDLLIGVTEFFRDPDAFNELQHNVLPDIIEAAVKVGELRVWVTPCASGEEAYSLAILIDELIQQRQYSLPVKIFATDVNADSIETASRGLYQEVQLRNVSQARLRNYFTQTEEGYSISTNLRQQIVFATHDVLQDAPFTKLSLISCRNLLIYWKPEVKKKVLSLFNFSLLDSGRLFLGPSESTDELESAYEAVSETANIYRKIAPVRFSQVEMSTSSSVRRNRRAEVASKSDIREKELSAVYDALLDDFMPDGMLIDEHNQVLHIFGQAADLLQLKRGRPSNDLMELLPSSFKVAVTNGLKRVRVEAKPVIYPGLEYSDDGHDPQSYRISVRPVQTRFAPKFLVTFEVIETAADSAEPTGTHVAVDEAAAEMMETLEAELRDTRESLHDSILNLKSTNEEMQSTNEELIASNEELQSTNEELHSVNEELYTVNSEHQRKITALTELTDDMDNLLDSIQVDTIYLDRDLHVRKFTLGIARTFKLLPQDIGRDFSSFNHELQYENLIDKIEHVLSTEQSTDEEVQDTAGNWYLMRLLPYNSLGSTDGVLLTLIDINRIKQTEQQLEELSEIVRASDDAIFRVSIDGSIRTWNRGAANLFMHEPASVIGKSIDVLNLDKSSEAAISNALNQIKDGGKIDHVELRASRRNGEEFDVQSTISPIYSSGGELDGASIILRDVTAQKKAEQRIREEVRRRDHFLAVLSHELRNPTAAIMSASSLLDKSAISDEKRVQCNRIITRNSQQLAKMMDDLLHVARVTHNKVRLEMKPTELVSMANQVVESVEHIAQEKNQTLTLELPDQPIHRIVDETRIIQAQTNLLINATKYTPENGSIRYGIWEEDDEVVIEVSDDGEGMPADLLQKIFDVFVQADQQLDRTVGGMGLGLPIVRMIAQSHGGTVSAESAGAGCGSTFTMRLPLQRVESAKVKGPAGLRSTNSSSIAGKRLLLVEDNEAAREMLAGYLELEQLDIRTAKNGVEAIEIFHEFNPEICIVDIGLPDMDGFQVAENMNQGHKRPELLIALTGYGQEDDRRKAKEAGFDLHLVKPVEPERLVKTIGDHSGKKSPRVSETVA